MRITKVAIIGLIYLNIVNAWEIVIVGDSKEIYKQNIYQYLKAKLGDEKNWYSHKALVEDFANDAVKPYGYMESKITVNNQNKKIVVNLGQITHYNKILLTKSTSCGEMQLNTPQMQNQGFNNQNYNQLKESILEEAQKNSFFNSKLQGKVIIKNNQADVYLHLECKEKYHFKNLIINSPFDNKLYTKHLKKDQTKINHIDFINFQEEIQNQNELGQHEFIEQIDHDKNEISWEVISRKIPNDYKSAGIGVITGKGIDFILQYKKTFIPSAHTWSAISHISKQELELDTFYTIPSLYFKNGQHKATLLHKYFPSKLYNQVSQSEFSYSLIHKKNNTQKEYGLSLQYNKDKPENQIISTYAFFPYITEQRSIISKFWQSKIHWKVKGNVKMLGSEFGFASAEININHKHDLNKKILLKADLSLGQIIYHDNIQDSWLYRTGGPNSIMGYQLDSIGPGSSMNNIRLGFFYNLNNTWYLGYWLTSGSASNCFPGEQYVGQALAADMQTTVGAFELALAKPRNGNIQISLNFLPL